MHFRFLLLTFGLALSLPPCLTAAEVVDRIVAVVDRFAITLTEAEQTMELARFRGNDRLTLSDAVESLIETHLIEREVKRYPGIQVSSEDISLAVESLRESYPSDDDFRRAMELQGLTDEGLEQLLKKQLRISLYLERRFRSMIYVTEEEIQGFYEKELAPRLKTAGKEPSGRESVENGIRSVLVERKFNERVNQWIEDLKSRSRIRRYVW
jgi:parvulin-like peptidyl-prolyl isomerase